MIATTLTNGASNSFTRAQWNLEKQARDSSPYGYHLLPQGTITYTLNSSTKVLNGLPAGKSYNAGTFNDTNYFNVPAALTTKLINASWWSVEFDFNLTTARSFSQMYATVNGCQFTLNINDTGLRWNNATNSILGGSVASNTWYHTAWVNNGGTSRTIWQDGQIVAGPSATQSTMGATVSLGRANWAANFYFVGLIDNVKISIYPNSASIPTKFPSRH